MGAGYVNLRGKRKRQQRKVGRKEEWFSSNCPKLSALVLALRGTFVTRAKLMPSPPCPFKHRPHFPHSFLRILDFLSFSFTVSIAAFKLGSLAFLSALLSASLTRWCLPEVDFRAFRAGGSWLSTPQLVKLALLTHFQAHCFLDFMSYCCHSGPSVVDVRLLDEVNWTFFDRIHWAQYCIYATCKSGCNDWAGECALGTRSSRSCVRISCNFRNFPAS